jgi:ubiquinol-cytochrome c reductase cytochrome b subunit
MSFWGATVITNFFSAIPGVGDSIVLWLRGGFAVDNATLNRFFSLHYLLPFLIVGVVILHIWALHQHGSNNPLGIDVKGPQDTVPFNPYYSIKDLFGVAVFLIIFSYFVFFAPNMLGHPDNYIPANPMATPADVVPEWYFLPFYAILRSIPSKLGGVIAMFCSILLLFAMPWLDSSKVRSARFRPIFKKVYWLLVLNCVFLGIMGEHSPNGCNMTNLCENGGISNQYIGQFFTFYYFFHFLVLVPILARKEKPLPLPESIAKAVLAGK